MTTLDKTAGKSEGAASLAGAAKATTSAAAATATTATANTSVELIADDVAGILKGARESDPTTKASASITQKGIWVFVPDEENAAAPAVTFPANQFPSTSTIPSLPFEKGPKVKIIFDRKDGTTSQHEWHFGPSPYIYRAGSQRGFSVKADMERAFSRVEEQKQRTQQYLGRQHEHVQREQEWRQRGAEHQRQRIMEDYASYMRDYERQMQNMHTRMQDQHRWMVEQTGRMQEQAVLGVSSSFASIPPMPPMPSMPPLPPLPPMAPI